MKAAGPLRPRTGALPKPVRPRFLSFGLGVILTSVACSTVASPAPTNSWPGADLFTNGPVRQIRLEISSRELSSLRDDAREFVPATVTDGTNTYRNVAVRLKGSVGSFRPIEDKPAWTLDFSHFAPGQKFHGLRRIHLNNSVEDPSYCNEWLGGELFRSAGIPAPRVAHAVVTLNGRRLGLYVLIEGFTEDFLCCYFRHVGGDLFEPGQGHDVNQRLKRISVAAPRTDRSALKELATVVLESGSPNRWERLEKVLDVNRFLTFMALEVMLCHRDGYCLARNNFKIYRDADTGKIMFLPHGMDQLLGNAELPWNPQPAGLVARAVLETAPGIELYRARFGSLFTQLFAVPRIGAQIDQIVGRLRPALTDAEFASVQTEAGHVKQRLAARSLALERQLQQPQPAVANFTNGTLALGNWSPASDAGGAVERVTGPDGKPSLHIRARDDTAAAWKTKVILNPGRYRFEGQARVAGVQPLPSGTHQGAGLRVAGQVRQSADLVGNSRWRTLAANFEVRAGATEVQLLCELRGHAGEAWFALDSLRIVQVVP